MEVLLAGTGSAEGWPNPFCSCASCQAERAAGRSRSPSTTLLDGVLALDLGPDAPQAMERAGARLGGLRHLLLTGGRDQLGPTTLLWRSWAQHPDELDVVGSPSMLAVARRWVGPTDPVRWHPVAAGDRVTLGPAGEQYAVRALAAGHRGEQGEAGPAEQRLAYDVAGPGGARLLYATDPLPPETLQQVAGRAYHVLLLAQAPGEHPARHMPHHGLTSFPRTLAALRRNGAVIGETLVVATHLGHHNPPTPVLSRILDAWGARVVDDGTRLTVGDPPGPGATPRRPTHPAATGGRTLVLGGARSGKSAYSESLLAAEPGVWYVATGTPPEIEDPTPSVGPGPDPHAQWATRVAAHRARRPEGWATVETIDLIGLLDPGPGAPPTGVPLLIDGLGTWLARRFDEHAAWTGADARLDAVHADADRLVGAWARTRTRVILVSDETGLGVVPTYASGRMFRDELGRLNQRLAEHSERVVLVVAGQPVRLR